MGIAWSVLMEGQKGIMLKYSEVNEAVNDNQGVLLSNIRAFKF